MAPIIFGTLSLPLLLLCMTLISLATSQITLCDSYENTTDTSGRYTFSTNIWAGDDSGQQCISVNESSSSPSSFSATWSWTANASDVHSFPNVNLNTAQLPLSVSNLLSLTLSASWYMYAGSYVPRSTFATQLDAKGLSQISTKATVALDMFLDQDVTKANNTVTPKFEVMIWYGRIGEADPIGYQNGVVGTHNLDGKVFDLYTGYNGHGQTVFSWLSPTNMTTITNLNVAPLVHFLWLHRFISESIYLGVIQFGTETIHTNGSNVTFEASDIDIQIDQGVPNIDWSGTVSMQSNVYSLKALLLLWAVACCALWSI